MADNGTSDIEKTIQTAARGISDLLGLGTNATSVVGILASGVYKAVQLGRCIRAAQQKANADLESRIRATSILSTPIRVDLTQMELLTFYSDPINRVAFPKLSEFRKEANQLANANASVGTLALLKAAKAFVPILQDDPELRVHPELAKILDTESLSASSPVRLLIEECVRLFPEEEMSYGQHYTRLESYWKDQLELELQNITRAELDAQRELNKEVGGLIKSAIFADQGFADQTLNLAKNLKDKAKKK